MRNTYYEKDEKGREYARYAIEKGANEKGNRMTDFKEADKYDPYDYTFNINDIKYYGEVKYRYKTKDFFDASGFTLERHKICRLYNNLNVFGEEKDDKFIDTFLDNGDYNNNPKITYTSIYEDKDKDGYWATTFDISPKKLYKYRKDFQSMRQIQHSPKNNEGYDLSGNTTGKAIESVDKVVYNLPATSGSTIYISYEEYNRNHQ